MTADARSAIDALQRAGRLRDVELYAFGHTAATETIRSELKRHGVELAAILDNNPAKQGGSLHGVPILAPAAITAINDPSVVLIASRFYSEMRQQLLELGYGGEIIRVGMLSIATGETPERDLDRGARLLDQLRSTHPGRHLIVCPFAALGDVYWALAYFPAFAAIHGLPPAVPVVVGDGCLQVARIFGYGHVSALTQAEMDDLVSAVSASEAQDATIAHHDRPYGDAAPVRVLDERFVAFTDIYRDLVYQLPAGAEPSFPQPEPSRAGSSPASELPYHRTVLLAPHAKSVLSIPWSFWEETAARHRSQGDTVVTVVHGDEQPLPGTLAIAIAIPELIAAVEHAGTFIGLRSGLCDVIHTARARKLHVFPDAYYSTTAYKVADFFALPGWESVTLAVS